MDDTKFQLWGQPQNEEIKNDFNLNDDICSAFEILEMMHQPKLSVNGCLHVFTNSWTDKNYRICSSIGIVTRDEIEIVCTCSKISKKKKFKTSDVHALANMIMFTENYYNKHNYVLGFECIFETSELVTAAKKNKTKRVDEKTRIQNLLVRCRSSNIWAYGMDIDDRKSGVGNMYIQFKGKNGGPDGGLYEYFDVPVKVYRQFISGTSKGHSFWQLIRNVYRYRKLTGDKRGKLPNAVN